MSFIVAVCAFLLCVLLLQSISNGRKQRKQLPPGPMGLPGIGNLLQIWAFSLETALSKWAAQYGKMFTISFGPNQTAIILNDAQLVRECYTESAFSGRMHISFLAILTKGKYGVAGTEGPVWEEQRRFVMKQLRDYGFGRKSMEALFMDEVTELCDDFRSQTGQPIQVGTQFNLAVINALWTIMTGQRYSHKDPELKAIFDKFINAFRVTNNASNWMTFAPWIKNIFPQLSGWAEIEKSTEMFHAIYHKAIKGHEATIHDGSPRDFIDAYLDRIRVTDDPASSFYGETGYKHLLGCLSDFFTAGAISTSSSLTFMMLFVAKYPEIQEKIYNEIVKVVGLSRVPNLEDRPKMIYTEAVFLEILRFVPLAPLLGFRKALFTKEFNGYVIPKDASIIVNADCIFHDPITWKDPNTFNPDRFLDHKGDSSSLIKNDNMISFSAGKRICPGEKFAKDSVFLFTTNILQKFRVLENPECPPNTVEWDTVFFVRCPKPFTVILKDR